MRRFVIPSLALLVVLVVGCSSAAPPAPMGLDKHPANTPETLASLARPPAGQTATAVAPGARTASNLQVAAPSTDRAPRALKVTVLSDQNAPRGIASLTVADRAALVVAAKSAGAIRIFCRGDRTRSSPTVRVRLLRHGAAIKRFLEAQGVEAAKIRLFVRSAGAFVADNSTPSGRAQNRRVEIQFV